MTAEVHGILLLDKPLGLSSAAAVARAKRLFAAAKAGHTGSLDPLAEGMLPICFGEATKFAAGLLAADKSYEVTARLGERTASADRESPVIERRALPDWSEADLEAALAAFPRDYQQVPPMHSAIKQAGRPLYEYARAGETRERAARRIEIHELRLLGYQAPDLRFSVRCSKGAYIRVLAEDIAATLDTIAHLCALRRTGVAPFVDQPLRGFEALESLDLGERRRTLLPVDAALQSVPRLELSATVVAALRQGRAVELAQDASGVVRMYSEDMGFFGLGEIREGGRLAPLRLIAAAANRA